MIHGALADDGGSGDSASMTAPPDAALAGCYVISLRPAGAHGGMRRAAARHGARVLALSPWALRRRNDEATCIRLRMALESSIVVATSPEAVRAAAALQTLTTDAGAHWIAVGSGTARALRGAGIAHVDIPTRMDSDGVLALPALGDVHGATIGLLTAPGGRDLIAPTLRARGATLHRADVYARVAIAPSSRSLATLRALHAYGTPRWLAIGSGGALDQLLAALDESDRIALRGARVVAASDRLATHADALGFHAPLVAGDARPRTLVDAAAVASTGATIG